LYGENSLWIKPVSLHTFKIGLPDIFVFMPPTAHQVRAQKDVTAASVAGGIMSSADIEQTNRMAVSAGNVTKAFAQDEIAGIIGRVHF